MSLLLLMWTHIQAVGEFSEYPQASPGEQIRGFLLYLLYDMIGVNKYSVKLVKQGYRSENITLKQLTLYICYSTF